MTFTSTAALTLTFAASLFAAAPAAANPDRSRAPLKPYRAVGRAMELEVYGRTHEVVRVRTPGATHAKFQVAPLALERETLVVFEVHSRSPKGSIPRWRCIAIEDVAECLGEARRFRWVVGDEEMVLSVTAASRSGPEGAALFAEAVRQRRGLTVADARFEPTN